MTIKIKSVHRVKLVLSYPSTSREDSLIRITIRQKKRNNINMPTALLERIQACSTASELMALLFATPLKDKALMAAFDRRIEELEREGQTINIHPLKHKHNGSTTPANAS